MTRLEWTEGDGARWSEGQFQARVIQLARDLGWGITQTAAKAIRDEAAALGVPDQAPPIEGIIYHPRYSLGSEPGWPDLTMVRRRDRRLIFAELKAEKGRLSARQVEVLDLLRVVETGRALCGSGPHGSTRPEPRLACCPPWLEVFVWRPSDLPAIAEVLR